jgi:hypothetical protein
MDVGDLILLSLVSVEELLVCRYDLRIAALNLERVIDLLLRVCIHKVIVHSHLILLKVWNSCLVQLKHQNLYVEVKALYLFLSLGKGFNMERVVTSEMA